MRLRASNSQASGATTRGACLLGHMLLRVAPTFGPSVTGATLRLLSPPPDGTVMQVRATATNLAGLKTAATTQRMLLDSTPPANATAGVLACTAGAVIEAATQAAPRSLYQNASGGVRLCWSTPGLTDPESGVLELQWQLWRVLGAGTVTFIEASTADESAVADGARLGETISGRSLLLLPAAFTHGHSYSVRLRAQNRAGLTGPWHDGGVVVVDETAPSHTFAQVLHWSPRPPPLGRHSDPRPSLLPRLGSSDHASTPPNSGCHLRSHGMQHDLDWRGHSAVPGGGRLAPCKVGGLLRPREWHWAL